MVLLCLSGSFIFWLPYFSEFFYVPMQHAFGFSHTQIGMLSSTFGFAPLLSYAPGGWLADRYSPRLLMSMSLVISGMGGFVFARFPPFEFCLVLYGLWGASASGAGQMNKAGLSASSKGDGVSRTPPLVPSC